MASVTQPTAQEVINRTGLTRYVTGQTSVQFEAWLAGFIDEAAAETALAVGESLFDSHTLTNRQALLLRAAVCYRVAAAALVSPELQKATGTHPPRRLEDAEAIAEAAERMRERAEQLEANVCAGAKLKPGATFVLPSFAATTYQRAATDRTPAERIELLDPRDNVASDDTARG